MEVLNVLVILVLMEVFSAQVYYSSYIIVSFWFKFFADIDECAENITNCTQHCINTVGSYYCNCSNGFLLSDDNHTCIG